MTKIIRLLWIVSIGFPTVINGQLIADHRIIEDYTKIPEQYLHEVKKMLVSVPGASHATAYRQGLLFLAEEDPRFVVNIAYEENYTENYLRFNQLGRDFWDDEWYTWYAWPEDQLPEEASSVKNMIRRNNDNDRNLAAIGFGWCWSMMSSYHSREYDPVHKVRWWGFARGGPDSGTLGWGLDDDDLDLTNNRVNLDTYLMATIEFMDYCKQNNYPTKVLFTTGPVDEYDGESGYQAWLKHEKIRAFVNEGPDRILFDYADILCYNNDGSTNTKSYSYGKTTYTYPFITDANLGDKSVGHIGYEGALRLGKAMWWLLARIAGWDGIQDETALNNTNKRQRTFSLNQCPNEIHIKVDSSIIHSLYILYNTTGTAIKQGRILKNTTIISTAQLPAGIYILRLDGKQKAHEKIILP